MKLDIQKASILKRISAGILDLILLVVLSVGFFALISVISDFDGHINAYNTYKAEAVIQADMLDYVKDASKIYLDADKTQIDIEQVNTAYDYYYSDAFQELSEEEQKIYKDKYTVAMEILQENPQAVKENMLVSSLTFVITSVGILLAYLILEFILPLILKNGQTIGKKVFGIAVMHTNCVKVSHITMFIRTILGKYAIETMIPVLMLIMLLFGMIGWVALVVLCGILALEIVCFLYKKQRTLIHDLIAKTTTVDLASQQIFNTVEEALEAQRLAQYEEGAEYVPGTFTFGKTTDGRDIVRNEQDNAGTDDSCGTDDVIDENVVEIGENNEEGLPEQTHTSSEEPSTSEVDVAPLNSVGDESQRPIK